MAMRSPNPWILLGWTAGPHLEEAISWCFRFHSDPYIELQRWLNGPEMERFEKRR